MLDKKIFIDFDGVIVDSEDRVIKRREKDNDISWNEFFEKIDWFQLLDESLIINDAINCILEGQEKGKDISILTKIHTLMEMQAKVEFIRDHNIIVPILFTPPHVKKSEIYLPSNGEILIDDSIKNLNNWKINGGTGIYFNKNNDINEEFPTIKTLKKVL